MPTPEERRRRIVDQLRRLDASLAAAIAALPGLRADVQELLAAAEGKAKTDADDTTD